MGIREVQQINNAGEISFSCPICSLPDTVFVSEHADFPSSSIWYCSDCNHWFAHPEPNNDTLAIHYRVIYSKQRHQYFGEPYNLLMERRATAQIQFIKQHLLSKENVDGLRCFKTLDIGCGVGALTAHLQREGADSIGYDSDGLAIEIGRKRWNANIHINTADGLNNLHGQFDLLTLSHIVEHLPDVSLTLTSILEHLRPGGYVFVEVPNCFSEMFTAKIDRESHLHFFSQRSLRRLLLKRMKLNVLSCETCGPPKLQACNIDGQSLRTATVKRFISKITTFPRGVFGKLVYQSSHIRTIYDGYYDFYPGNDNGLWLRCLAQKNSTQSGEIC